MSTRVKIPVVLLILFPGLLGAYEAPFLWRIETYPPSFLFGTAHINHERILDLPTSVVRAIHHVDALYGEAGVVDPEDTVVDHIHKLRLPPPQTLRNLLTPEQWERFRTIANEVVVGFQGTPADYLNAFTPWIVAQTLRYDIYFVKGLGPWVNSPVLDDHVANLAWEAGKELGQLERVGELIDALNTMSMDSQIQELMIAVDLYDVPNPERSFELLLDLYLSGDESLIEELSFPGDNASAHDREWVEVVLHLRNVHMADRIEKLLTENPGKAYFFTSGTAHLVGEKSINDLLEKRGYRITRVRQDWMGLLHTDLGNGWRHAPWLGWIWAPEESAWIWHPAYDWMHFFSHGTSHWIYVASFGEWYWTEESWYPHAWRAATAEWIQLDPNLNPTQP